MPSPERYLPTYRQEEIRFICDQVRRGESLCLVGIAGIGKSNITNFLRAPQNLRVYLGDQAASTHFCLVNATVWQQTPQSLWELMYIALDDSTAHLQPRPSGDAIIPMAREERAFARLRSRLKWACQELGQKIIFLLDDFDVVFDRGPVAMIEQLSFLRNDGNRDKLSYVVFTRQLPHILGRKYDLEHKSNFFTLIRDNHYSLEPYSKEDVRQMLAFLNANAGYRLRPHEIARIQMLAGGHARLLKVVFELWLNEGPPTGDMEQELVGKLAVCQECRRIMDGLHPQEREVAVLAARRLHTPDHSAIVEHLVCRGLLVSVQPIKWFSSLLERFLLSNDA